MHIVDRRLNPGSKSLEMRIEPAGSRRRVLHVPAMKLSPASLADPALFLAATRGAMRTLVIVFVLALISIAFEVYSDAAMTSAEIRHGAPDPVTVAIVHGLKRG
jgi:hypothetical protein